MVFKSYPDKSQDRTDDTIWDICVCGHDDTEHELINPLYGECHYCECPKYNFQMRTTLADRMKIRRMRKETIRANDRRTD